MILQGVNDRTILAYRGASELLSQAEIPFKKLKTKWLYLAPLSGELCHSFESLVDFAKEHNIQIAVNPGIAQLSLPNFADIAKKIDVLIMNQDEASFLTKTSDRQEVFKKMNILCSGITMMTMGGEGVLVSDGVNSYFAKPHPERIMVDTTGAGDSFASGFLSEYMRPARSTTGVAGGSANIEASIQLGMANSEGCLSQIGAKNGLLKQGQQFEKVKVTKEECDNNVCIIK